MIINEKELEWQKADLPSDLQQELGQIPESELTGYFDGYPEFGTGGIRALMGPGTNRLNIYTIARATEGLSQYLLAQNLPTSLQRVVISYDTRLHSEDFANVSANILRSHGIAVDLSDDIRPTPELSFAVRHFQAFLGIMITASHNPSQYNGYKVYDQNGGQITLQQAAEITDYIAKVPDELALAHAVVLDDSVKLFGKEVDEAYLSQLAKVDQDPEENKSFGSELTIVYTPLHGTGENLVVNGLKRAGFTNLHVVEEQATRDPYFSTVRLPNPEFHEAFTHGLALAKEVNADIVIATDPDADRMGLAVLDHGEYVFMSGNQLGALFVDYLAKKKQAAGQDMSRYRLVKTIVTSDFGKTVAAHYGVQTVETLTGFKFIGEQADRFEAEGDKQFFLGYEESFGFLVEPFVRDKDSIQAALLACQVALSAKRQQLTLISLLAQLEKTYGAYQDTLLSDQFQDDAEEARILARVDQLRQEQPQEIAGLSVLAYEDYESLNRLDLASGSHTKLTLPESNVLKVIFNDDAWLAVRPSGTEPKIKTYVSVRGASADDASKKIEDLTQWVNEYLYL